MQQQRGLGFLATPIKASIGEAASNEGMCRNVAAANIKGHQHRLGEAWGSWWQTHASQSAADDPAQVDQISGGETVPKGHNSSGQRDGQAAVIFISAAAVASWAG